MAHKRLTREFQSIFNNPLHHISASPVGENFFLWNISLIGPENTPYEEGVFNLLLKIPTDYPFKSPKIEFTTKIYHPNINRNGDVCLSILGDKWSAASSIRSILLAVYTLFIQPNPDDPLVAEIANMYKTNKEEFERLAKEWTIKYAT